MKGPTLLPASLLLSINDVATDGSTVACPYFRIMMLIMAGEITLIAAPSYWQLPKPRKDLR